MKSLKPLIALAVLALQAPASKAEQSPELTWLRQFAPSQMYTESRSVAVDAGGNAYVTGDAYGKGVFLNKWSPTGDHLWTLTRTTPQGGLDRGYGVSVDGQGDIYMAGYTRGDLAGPNIGSDDGYLLKYDKDGNSLWSRQFGTTSYDRIFSAPAIDSAGNVYVAGYTGGGLAGPAPYRNPDAFLRKYDADGSHLWTRQISSPSTDYGICTAVDARGDVYLGGSTMGDLGGPNLGGYDAFLAKYNSQGDQLWLRQYGTENNEGYARLATGGPENMDLYAGASVYRGRTYTWVTRHQPDGEVLWSRTFGRYFGGMAVDALGNVYVAGETNHNFNSGDASVIKLDGAGDQLWRVSFGTWWFDGAADVALDGLGHVHVAGNTAGPLVHPRQAYVDGFVGMFTFATVQVAVDIKPGSDENPVNLLAQGILPVAILGSETFDVGEVDQATLELAGSEPQERGKSGNIGAFEDVNGDGFLDLMLLFPIRDLKLDPDAVLAELTGDLLDGTPILGGDSVRLLKAGDANLDGFVDIEDFFILKANFDKDPAGWSEGDFNDDGLVDIQDFAALKAHFGEGAAQGAAAAVPEPATLSLLAVGGLVLLKRKRKS